MERALELPHDVEALTTLVLTQRQWLAERDEMIAQLEQHNRLLVKLMFGRSSEKRVREPELLQPIAEQLRKEVLASPVVYTDDTPVTLAMPRGSQGGSRQARVGDYFRDVLVRISTCTDVRKLTPHGWQEHYAAEVTERRHALLREVAGER